MKPALAKNKSDSLRDTLEAKRTPQCRKMVPDKVKRVKHLLKLEAGLQLRRCFFTVDAAKKFGSDNGFSVTWPNAERLTGRTNRLPIISAQDCTFYE
jgi:hypothetical protein